MFAHALQHWPRAPDIDPASGPLWFPAPLTPSPTQVPEARARSVTGRNKTSHWWPTTTGQEVSSLAVFGRGQYTSLGQKGPGVRLARATAALCLNRLLQNSPTRCPPEVQSCFLPVAGRTTHGPGSHPRFQSWAGNPCVSFHARPDPEQTMAQSRTGCAEGVAVLYISGEGYTVGQGASQHM